mmetsp:Transcript_141690/g.353280  ORF Transcript_141690/g.353280 Transcript_141690/m.353280 type:complete len:1321 (+) Transcript_141690:145-4107(+)
MRQTLPAAPASRGLPTSSASGAGAWNFASTPSSSSSAPPPPAVAGNDCYRSTDGLGLNFSARFTAKQPLTLPKVAAAQGQGRGLPSLASPTAVSAAAEEPQLPQSLRPLSDEELLAVAASAPDPPLPSWVSSPSSALAAVPTASAPSESIASAGIYGQQHAAVREEDEEPCSPFVFTPSGPPKFGQPRQFFETEDAAVQRIQTGIFGADRGIDDLIHKCPVFRECSYDFVEEVLVHMRKQLWRPGQVIVEEDSEKPLSMFFVLWGSVSISRGGHVCKELCEGQSFGEAHMLGIMTRWQFSVFAKTSCMVCELPGSEIMDVLQEHPEEAEYFDRIVDQYAISRHSEQSDGWKALRHCASMRHCSEPFLIELDDAFERRVYFPGEVIATEGTEDAQLFVLDRGTVAVEIAGRTVRQEEVPAVHTRLSYGEDFGLLRNPTRTSVWNGGGDHDAHEPENAPRTSIIHRAGRQVLRGQQEASDDPGSGGSSSDPGGGGLGDEEAEATIFCEELLLGILSRHSTTLRARKICDVRILHRHAFLRILSKHVHDRHVVEPLMDYRHNELFPPWNIEELPVFRDKGWSQAFFTFLRSHVEKRMFGAEERVQIDDFVKNIHPPLPDNNPSICRLNWGKVQLVGSSSKGSLKGGLTSVEHEQTELGAGSVITGETFWKKRSVRALEVCYVSILHRGVIARALEELSMDRDLYLSYLAQSQKTRNNKSAQVAKILRERSIFAKTSPEFLNEIIRYGTIRVFMPGDRIIEQGTDGTSMFILWVGTANVVLETMEELDNAPARTLTNVGSLTHGSVFGELVMLGVQSKRTASIVAGTLCCTWEVEHQVILSILDRHPVERHNFLKLVEEHLGKMAAKNLIYHHLFSGFHQQFRTLIGVNCERKLYFPGETITREGTTGDRLYIVNLGTAVVQMHNQHVMQVKGGSHFGFASICLHSERDKERYPVTVVTETMCQVLIVTRGTYQHALQKYPEMREIARRLEEEEKARVRRQRDAFTRMVYRRRKLRCIVEALRGSSMAASMEGNPTNSALLEVSFQGWHTLTLRTAELRREEEEQRTLNAGRIEAWLSKRKVQLAHVKPKMDLKVLIDRNLRRRGPLKLARKAPSPPPPRMHTLSYYSTMQDSESPYMSPCPVWVRMPLSARQSRRLPPLSDIVAPGCYIGSNAGGSDGGAGASAMGSAQGEDKASHSASHSAPMPPLPPPAAPAVLPKALQSLASAPAGTGGSGSGKRSSSGGNEGATTQERGVVVRSPDRALVCGGNDGWPPPGSAETDGGSNNAWNELPAKYRDHLSAITGSFKSSIVVDRETLQHLVENS